VVGAVEAKRTKVRRIPVRGFGVATVLAGTMSFAAEPALADLYEGWVGKRIDNRTWILVVGGDRYYVEMSMCLSLALPTEDVIVKSLDAILGPGDEVIFVDDGGEECWVRSARKLSR
jgi:hypothetical protein